MRPLCSPAARSCIPIPDPSLCSAAAPQRTQAALDKVRRDVARTGTVEVDRFGAVPANFSLGEGARPEPESPEFAHARAELQRALEREHGMNLRLFNFSRDGRIDEARRARPLVLSRHAASLTPY